LAAPIMPAAVERSRSPTSRARLTISVEPPKLTPEDEKKLREGYQARAGRKVAHSEWGRVAQAPRPVGLPTSGSVTLTPVFDTAAAIRGPTEVPSVAVPVGDSPTPQSRYPLHHAF